MGCFRHYKALVRKNWINWKRTPFGSVVEVFLPFVLMFVLVYMRAQVKPDKRSNEYLHQLRHPLYPVAQPSGSGLARSSLYDSLWHAYDLDAFTEFASYQNLRVRYNKKTYKGYFPMMDPSGPFWFYPPHCHPKEAVSKVVGGSSSTYNNLWHSPLIGVFNNGNLIEKDVVNSLESLFYGQKVFYELWNYIGTFDFLVGYYLYMIGIQFKAPNDRANIGHYFFFTEFRKFKYIGDFRFTEFENQQDFDDYVTHPRYGVDEDREAICFAIDITENAYNSYELNLHFDDHPASPYDSIPNQQADSAHPANFIPTSIEYSLYQWFGFGYLQNWVANAILKRSTGDDWATIVAMLIPIRMPPTVLDEFNFMLYASFAFFIVVMYIPVIYRTMFRIVQEKETRAKETMRIMGMKELPYWLSWATDYLVKNLIISTGSWAVVYMWVFKFSDGRLLWMLIFFYGQFAFGMILVAQTVFARARYAGIATSLVYFGLSMLNTSVNQDDTTYADVVLVAIFSPAVAMIQTVYAIVHFETAQVGQNFGNWQIPVQNFDSRSGITIIMCAGIYWPIVGLYLDQVIASTYGIRKHPCFCLMPSYWSSCQKKRTSIKHSTDTGDVDLNTSKQAENANLLQAADVQSDNGSNQGSNQGSNKNSQNSSSSVLTPGQNPGARSGSGSDGAPRGSVQSGENSSQARMIQSVAEQDIIEKTFQFETRQLAADSYESIMAEQARNDLEKRVLSVSGLKKTYDTGFQAVKGLNMKMYADQIFVLLGHNGAGKTTTMGMLTGLHAASEGSAEVFGTDIFEQFDEVRKFMGICPQHDVLFELLTPREHLEIFFELKGAEKTDNHRQEIDKLLQDCGVWPKRNFPAYGLSGGNRRKLSVAIALCGNSKFIMLDEPTAGLDLTARRHLWDMLREYKQDRIILLTTHYMDEADVLGDRIAIMKGGLLECLGSSMFLKQRFGVGYVLKMTKKNQFTEQNASDILDFIQERLGDGVTMQDEVKNEVVFKIPTDQQSGLPAFFDDLDTNLDQFNVVNYSIAQTTLSEVFEKVTGFRRYQDDITEKQSEKQEKSSEDSSNKIKSSTLKLEGEDEIHGSINQSAAEEDKPNVSDTEKGPTPTPKRKKKLRSKIQSSELSKQKSFDLFGAESDHSFWNNFTGLCRKKINVFRRDKKLFAYEVFIPGLIIFFGILLTRTSWFDRSPVKIFTPDLLPLPQKIVMNQYPVDWSSDLNATVLAENLPMPDQWDVYFRNESDNLPTFSEVAKRFGQSNASSEPYFYNGYQIYEANRAYQKYKFFSHVNMTSPDVSVLFPQFMYESILKVANDDPEFEFKLKVTPYPLLSIAQNTTKTAELGFVVFVMSTAYSLLLAIFIAEAVEERLTRLKHFQITQGMQLKAYWLHLFLTDLFKMYCTIAMNILIFMGFQLGFGISMITLLIYPFGVIPFTYVTSFGFQSTSVAQSLTLFFNFTALLIFPIVTYFMRTAEKSQADGDLINQIFKLHPSYCVSSSLYFDNGHAQLYESRKNSPGGPVSNDAMHITNVKGDWLFLVGHFFFWSFVLLLIETEILCRPCKKRTQRINQARGSAAIASLDADQVGDEDVQIEAERVQNLVYTPGENLTVRVKNLRKVYKAPVTQCGKGKVFQAVTNLSFGIEIGECFALLGVNGAGKSTTFKTLCNEVQASSGSVMIGKFDVNADFSQVRKMIGYCPQTNPIFDSLTVRMHVEYYAQIKGIPADQREEIVLQAIIDLDIMQYIDVAAGSLSGGNKRKLAVAIACIGNPKVILLDEPSAGMDPESRKFMWEALSKICQDKTSAVILTTHSMEEAEALSTKMGIMLTGGKFKCFGSAQHIKDKYSTGFLVEVKVKQPDQEELQFLFDAVTQQHAPDSSDPEKAGHQQEKYYTIAEAEQKLKNANLGEFVSRYTLLKLLKICHPTEEASKNQMTNLTKQKAKSKDNEASSDTEKQSISDIRDCTEAFIPGSQLSKMLYTHKALFGTVKKLCTHFSQVELLEHYGDYMKIRVPKHNFTVGYLFGVMETFKQNKEISDYSVSQTSLEQIFHEFAKGDGQKTADNEENKQGKKKDTTEKKKKRKDKDAKAKGMLMNDSEDPIIDSSKPRNRDKSLPTLGDSPDQSPKKPGRRSESGRIVSHHSSKEDIPKELEKNINEMFGKGSPSPQAPIRRQTEDLLYHAEPDLDKGIPRNKNFLNSEKSNKNESGPIEMMDMQDSESFDKSVNNLINNGMTEILQAKNRLAEFQGMREKSSNDLISIQNELDKMTVQEAEDLISGESSQQQRDKESEKGSQSSKSLKKTSDAPAQKQPFKKAGTTLPKKQPTKKIIPPESTAQKNLAKKNQLWSGGNQPQEQPAPPKHAPTSRNIPQPKTQTNNNQVKKDDMDLL